MKNSSKYCPGGVCEIQIKEKVQTFNPIQKTIVSISFILLAYGTYAYFYKLDNKTFFGQNIALKMMSAEELKALEDAEYAKEAAEFDNDDDF